MTYTVNNMNQYTTVGGEPLSYDANGNLTSAPGLSLQYDSWNRLISAATESNLVLFAYDGRHRCVKRVEIQNGVGRTTIMVWGHEPSQGWGLLEERGPNGELLARHVHGPSVDDLVLSELNGAVYYYHHDHLNSTVAVTDESGNVVEQYRYDVYGQPSFFGPDGTPRAESALGLRFLFTGREWLASLALYDYRHRAYSPTLGRFLQMDPLGFGAGDVNVYRYCGNSALNQIDPMGLCKTGSHQYIDISQWRVARPPNYVVRLRPLYIENHVCDFRFVRHNCQGGTLEFAWGNPDYWWFYAPMYRDPPTLTRRQAGRMLSASGQIMVLLGGMVIADGSHIGSNLSPRYGEPLVLGSWVIGGFLHISGTALIIIGEALNGGTPVTPFVPKNNLK